MKPWNWDKCVLHNIPSYKVTVIKSHSDLVDKPATKIRYGTLQMTEVKPDDLETIFSQTDDLR